MGEDISNGGDNYEEIDLMLMLMIMPNIMTSRNKSAAAVTEDITIAKYNKGHSHD